MDIKTVADFDAALAEGKWAWPGGYPKFFILDDGEALSFEGAAESVEEIHRAIEEGSGQWLVVGVAVNWEDSELYCVHTEARIPSAYGDNDEETS